MTDLRLLAPAVLAWVVAAGCLGLGVGGHVAIAAVAASCGVVLALTPAGRRTAGPRTSGRARPSAAVDLRCWSVVLVARLRWPAVLTAVLVALLQVAAAGHAVLRDRGGVTALAAERASVTAVVVITGDPVLLDGRDDDTRVLRDATVVLLDARGLRRDTGAPVLLTGDQALMAPAWRSTVEIRGRLRPAERGDDRVAVLAMAGAPVLVHPPGAVASSAERLRAGLRRSVDDAPPDARGLLPGLVIGDTSRTPEDLTAAMQATGMSHLTAVSGSNVAVVTGLVLGVCVLLGVPRRLRPALALVALAGFVVLARPEPSVVRAAAMGAIGLLGLSRSRRSAGPPVLGAAIVVVLALDPWLARSFGFALSSLATLGLLLFTRPWGDAVGARLPTRLAPLGPAVAIPVAAQAMTAPLVVVLQGSVSTVGVLANFLAAPLVPIATVAGVVAALLSVVSLRGAEVVAWVGVVPTTLIATVARRFAELPGGTLPWPDGAAGAVLLAVLTLAVLLTGRALVALVAARPVTSIGIAMLAAAALVPTRAVTWPPTGWRVVVCDVGQGDAVVLRSGAGRAVLVDAGPDPPLVDRCLRRLGVRTLDAVVLSHFHADHVDGLAGAVRGRDVAQVLVGPVREPVARAEEVDAITDRHGIPVVGVRAGDRLTLGDVDAVVWSPWRRIADGSVPNNASVVLAARIGGVDALLLGDVEREAARDLLLRIRREPALAVAAGGFEVVKTPHHGSANLDDQLMAAVRAPVGIVSVGEGNDYGHPAARHLEVLHRNGYAVFRTDVHGDVALVELDGRVRVVTARGRRADRPRRRTVGVRSPSALGVARGRAPLSRLPLGSMTRGPRGGPQTRREPHPRGDGVPSRPRTRPTRAVYRRRRLVAVGLLALVLFGAYSAVAQLVQADSGAASAGKGESAPGTRAAEATGRTPAVPTQAPGPVDCAVTPCIALTFDDGPVPQSADVVDLLATRGARATFYVIGKQAKRYPAILTRATSAGHEIGNHSWGHVNLRSADADTAAEELARTSEAVKAATGSGPRTMRPPFGDATTSAAAKAGMPQVLWSLDTLDWENRNTPAIVQRVLGEAEPGGIVLMHDVHATTRAALPQIVDGLLGRGYALVTVSELLGTDLTPGKVYRSGPAPTT